MKIFIDEHQNVLRGEEAEAALRGKADARYLTEGKGVIKVPIERWREAQNFEKQHWMDRQQQALDDRNYDHARHYQDYRALQGMQFQAGIELGCGPFTNLRLIAPVCSVRSVSLLDPLIETYFTHPHCQYDRQRLRYETSLARSLRRPGLRRIHRILTEARLPVLTRSVPVHEIFATPIEQMPVRPNAYDLVVMINVIEHCYDIELIWENILSISRPGAIFVFHDKYYDHNKLTVQLRDQLYDAGHPLRIDKSVITAFLDSKFDAIYRHESKNEYSFEGIDMSYESIYFIGRLKSS